MGEKHPADYSLRVEGATSCPLRLYGLWAADVTCALTRKYCDVELTPMEKGSKVQYGTDVPKAETCPVRQRGSVLVEFTDVTPKKICKKCLGQGYWEPVAGDISVQCPDCDGTGEVINCERLEAEAKATGEEDTDSAEFHDLGNVRCHDCEDGRLHLSRENLASGGCESLNVLRGERIILAQHFLRGTGYRVEEEC